MTDTEWMSAVWRTPAQSRDLLIELSNPVTTECIEQCRALCLNETNKRKLDNNYIQCARCKGYHGQKENIDGLCEKCEQETASYRYDKQHNLI